MPAAANPNLLSWLKKSFALVAVAYNSSTSSTVFDTPCEPETELAQHALPNILIFGDSIDRYMLEDGCEKWGGVVTRWATNFSYKVGASADGMCNSSLGTLAFLNIYGSAQKGPYLLGHTNTPDDPFADTELRVQNGLDQYVAKFGAPQFVFYRSELWDLHVTAFLNGTATAGENHLNAQQREVLFERFFADNLRTLSDIRSKLPDAIVCTHTVPNIKWGMVLFPMYQNALRYVSEVGGLCMYDFNQLLQGADPNEYLRDGHHPSKPYSASFADIVMRSARTWTSCCASKAAGLLLGCKIHD
jgi:hypothetical protein